MFKDVDVCCSRTSRRTWASRTGRRRTRTAWCPSSTCSKGESAHAAGAPWRGRSALDAVELMDVGWNFRREHLRLAQRSHYVITNGGDQPNVVPPNAARLVLLPRGRLRPHHGHVAHRRQHGQGRDADDRHHLHVAPAGQRVARPFQQADRRGRCTRTSRRSGCRNGRRTIRSWRRRCRRS